METVDNMGQEKERKRAIVEEYLKGGVSLRELGKKYGIDHRMIHRWVKAQEGWDVVGVRSEIMAEMPKDVRKLQRELYEARLKAKLFETMIEIAEDEMGIVIRKKRGAKQ